MSKNQTFDPQQQGSSRQPYWRLMFWSIPVCLLMLPLIAMQFTEEVDWKVGDFVIMGALMGTVGLGIEFAVRLSADVRYRVAAVLALLSGFLLIWVNLAVGIIGDEDQAANLFYLAVVGIGLVGAVATRFTVTGLARTLYLMVGALVLIAIVVLGTGLGAESADVVEVLGVTGFFAILFLVPGLLFQQSANQANPDGE